ncbi:hypothetical protein, partial [Comamonas jiangduensis]|uniref:hypothetical protein n=1 Tax=Comamonas jiangduensis TaxID=1194168 RepID=UPI00289708D8
MTVVQTVFIGLFAGFALSGNPQLTTASAGTPEFLIRENAGISRQKIMRHQDSRTAGQQDSRTAGQQDSRT